MAALTEEQAMQVLNFEQNLNVGILDTLMVMMNSGQTVQAKSASNILTQFKEHEQAWTRVHQIVEEAQNLDTKYFALQVLEDLVKTKWKVLPPEQTEGIKNFLVQLIIKYSSDFPTLEAQRIVLQKLDVVLVQILKRDWPHKWPTFISDIVGASKSSESLCQNNMTILKLLSEEVFDFSKGQMTQVKAQTLKNTMCAEFAQIFELCQFVMQYSEVPTLVEATLQTLLRFLSWIPIGYIFEFDLIVILVTKFLPVEIFRNVTLQCLTEIGTLVQPEQDEKFASMIQAMMEPISALLPPHTNLQAAYETASVEDKSFVQNLALFFGAFLKEHGSLLESRADLHGTLLDSLQYLVMISRVDDTEVFKICLEYWNALASSLYKAMYHSGPAGTYGGASFGGVPLLLGHQGPSSPRHELYADVLSQVRLVMVSKMAKPEEVLVVENDAGEVVREHLKDTDTIELYKQMRETLVYLTHLNYIDTERIMTNKLNKQVDGSEWSWKNLNTLCWAIGSISGAMSEDDEKRFLVTVIKELLGLCETKRGKDHKAIIASNIMYIVGQYPRFLRAHWKFLKTVVNKLFEFMHEQHEGVQDMACDTFIKIAQKCKKHFVQIQVGEVTAFIDEILSNMHATVCDLEPRQVHTFYEAVGHMISAQNDSTIRSRLIEKLMMDPNRQWATIKREANSSVMVFMSDDVIAQLNDILKKNVHACLSIGHPFIVQLSVIYLDILLVYRTLSGSVEQAIASQGETATKQPLIRSMRAVKKEILKLIGTWISKSENPIEVVERFIPPLLEAVLGDYQRSIPASRDAEVLGTMATIVEKLKDAISSEVLPIFAAVFESTLEMINRDFETYPEHRREFYNLLQAINSHCFGAFASLNGDQLKMVVDAIVFGIRHPMRDVADTSLKIMKELFDGVLRAPLDFQQSFYQSFFVDILQHMFAIVTDSMHYSGLNMQSVILAQMFAIVETGTITVPLQPDPSISNQAFLEGHVAGLLQRHFPNLQLPQIQIIILGFFTYDRDPQAFKGHLRDFLVQCRESAGDDMTEIYIQEREAQLKQAQQDKMQQLGHIPGMFNPHEAEMGGQRASSPLAGL